MISYHKLHMNRFATALRTNFLKVFNSFSSQLAYKTTKISSIFSRFRYSNFARRREIICTFQHHAETSDICQLGPFIILNNRNHKIQRKSYYHHLFYYYWKNNEFYFEIICGQLEGKGKTSKVL